MDSRRIHSLLIANRGEIAVRIMQTARLMGIDSVAVHSRFDNDALHVRCADRAILLESQGQTSALSAYLDGELIIAAATRMGVDAVHPGYGLLSESANFARSVRRAGFIFVGPSADSIESMGNKARAKGLLESWGIPLLLGYHGEDQSNERLLAEAGRIGLPLLIKPVSGGGGKGMQLVQELGNFVESLAEAQRVAGVSFGDETVLLERYMPSPRHVEVQLLCDQQGEGRYLYERDCSLQRRHQKVIEEAPAPGLTAETRKLLGETALRVAQAVGYEGAGTVEFLLQQDADEDIFYFMEMNTRLQVEHPVTEMITGLDLVEWQLRIAQGEALSFTQSSISCRGHAIEMRLYAEQVDRQFLPATGQLKRWLPPLLNDNVRLDRGVECGDEVSSDFDPMLAKLICWGEDRDQALARARRALAQWQIAGVMNNKVFLNSLLCLPAFVDGQMNTHTIADNLSMLLSREADGERRGLLLAALALIMLRENLSIDPWQEHDRFRLGGTSTELLSLWRCQRRLTIAIEQAGGAYSMSLVGESVVFSLRGRWQLGEGVSRTLQVMFDGLTITVGVMLEAESITVFEAGNCYDFSTVNPISRGELSSSAEAGLIAPMSGRIIECLVAEGDDVLKGQRLLVMEAMKMEYAMTAGYDGVVDKLYCRVGEQVAEGKLLAALKALE